MWVKKCEWKTENVARLERRIKKQKSVAIKVWEFLPFMRGLGGVLAVSLFHCLGKESSLRTLLAEQSEKKLHEEKHKINKTTSCFGKCNEKTWTCPATSFLCAMNKETQSETGENKHVFHRRKTCLWASGYQPSLSFRRAKMGVCEHGLKSGVDPLWSSYTPDLSFIGTFIHISNIY